MVCGEETVMDDTPDDGRLIEASFSEPAMFAELFDRHYPAVHALCVRRVGRSESEDIAGETFCRAFAHRRRFEVSRTDARPWLYGIALNLVRTHHRGRSRRGNAYAREAFLADTELDFPSGVERAVDARRELATVMDALLRFPAEDVDALLLHVWEELGYDEIADVLGVPASTVRSRLYRVRQRLRDAIDRDESGRVSLGRVSPLDTRRTS
jgi:RNA polymerase sigma factor (sigma-70 family)